MLAFKVEVDGKELAVAGVEDWAVLSFHLNATRTDASERPFGHVRTGVGGLSLPDENSVSHHFRWKDRDLNIGSRIVVTVIETDTPHAPVKRYRSDSAVQEDPFTEEEAREMRLQDYLELKKEFGDKHG
jgi:hypothetical protein